MVLAAAAPLSLAITSIFQPELPANLQEQKPGMGVKAHIKVNRRDSGSSPTLPYTCAEYGLRFWMLSQLVFTTDLNLLRLQLPNNNSQQIYREDLKDMDKH